MANPVPECGICLGPGQNLLPLSGPAHPADRAHYVHLDCIEGWVRTHYTGDGELAQRITRLIRCTSCDQRVTHVGGKLIRIAQYVEQEKWPLRPLIKAALDGDVPAVKDCFVRSWWQFNRSPPSQETCVEAARAAIAQDHPEVLDVLFKRNQLRPVDVNPLILEAYQQRHFRCMKKLCDAHPLSPKEYGELIMQWVAVKPLCLETLTGLLECQPLANNIMIELIRHLIDTNELPSLSKILAHLQQSQDPSRTECYEAYQQGAVDYLKADALILLLRQRQPYDEKLTAFFRTRDVAQLKAASPEAIAQHKRVLCAWAAKKELPEASAYLDSQG